MGLFDFFDRYNFANPEAQIINSPLFNTAANETPQAPRKSPSMLIDPMTGMDTGNKPMQAPARPPIKYGVPGSAMLSGVMDKLGAAAGGQWKDYGGGLSVIGPSVPNTPPPSRGTGGIDMRFANNAAFKGRSFTDADLPAPRTLPEAPNEESNE